MKRAAFIICALVLWLATCQAPNNMPAPLDIPATQTNIPATETTIPPTPTEEPVIEGKLPVAPFDSQTYINEAAGFALEYPTGWTMTETVLGERGIQIQFTSAPGVAEAPVVPEGQTRVTAVIYQWDPKNDLAAYVEQRKTAWEASGFTVLEEQPMTLELGLSAVEFTVQTPDAESVFLVAALKDQYLVISGEGDLELVKQIVERVRPISQ